MKNTKAILFTLWTAGIMLCVLVSIIALLFSACAKTEDEPDKGDAPFNVETAQPGDDDPADPPEDPNGPDTPDDPEPPAPVTPTRLGETADAGREYLDKITFLGDSTTYGIGYYYDHGYPDLCPPSQIWTPASGTLTLSQYNIATIVYPETKEEISIVEAVTRAKPEILMITLGVNGISFMDEATFIEAYTDLVHNVQTASPDTRIILNSIYPVATNYEYLNQINNEKIRAANGWVERIAENTGCRFLYSFEAVVGEDGNLPLSSQNGDGLHLTGETFGTVMNYIRTHAYQ